MKSNLAKLFIGLTLCTSMVVGCSSSPSSSKRRKSSSNPDSSLNSGQSQPSNQGVGEEIKAYEGNKNRQIGSIPNTPVESYKQSTLDKIGSLVRLIHGTTSEEMVDAFADCMLAFKLGDDLACAVCDYVIGFSDFSQEIVSSENYSKIIVDYCYQGMKILNSIDFGDAENFFTTLNNTYRDVCTGDSSYYDVSSMKIEKYFDPDFGYRYLSYSEYKDLKDHLNEYDNNELNELVAAYDQVYGSMRFTDQQVEVFNNAKAERERELQEIVAVPQYLVDFIAAHANEDSKTLLLNKIKLVVDAFEELSPVLSDLLGNVSLIGATKKAMGSNYLYVRAGQENYNYFWLYEKEDDSSENAEEKPVFDVQAFATNLLQKRQVIFGLAKAILVDEEIGDLLVDAVDELLIPLLEARAEENDENTQILDTLSRKVKTLTGKHISVFADFILNAANELYDEDVLALYAYIVYGDESFDLFAFIDKYLPKLNNLIASLSADDKALITGLTTVVGVDVFDAVNEFNDIYNNKDLSTEEGQEAFFEALDEFGEEIGYNFYSAVGLSFKDSDDYNYPQEENVAADEDRVTCSINNQAIKVGMTQDDILECIYIDCYTHYDFSNSNGSYFGTFNVSSSLSSWNSYVQMYEQRYNNLSEDDKYTVEGQKDYVRSQLSISDIELESVNTSSCGYSLVNLSFKMRGKTYTFSMTVFVVPVNPLPTVDKVYHSGDYSFEKGSAFDLGIYELNASFQIYDSIASEDVDLTATKAGRNVYISKPSGEEYYSYYDYCLYVYYVVNPSAIQNSVIGTYSDTGVYFTGEEDFYDEPYYSISYEYNGLRFHKSYELPFSADLVNNKTPGGQYTTTYEGNEFSYVIVDSDSGEILGYEFDLDDRLTGEINQPQTMSASVEIKVAYQYKIDGNDCYSIRWERYYNVTLTEFVFSGNDISFMYYGQRFVFDATRVQDYLNN